MVGQRSSQGSMAPHHRCCVIPPAPPLEGRLGSGFELLAAGSGRGRVSVLESLALLRLELQPLSTGAWAGDGEDEVVSVRVRRFTCWNCCCC